MRWLVLIPVALILGCALDAISPKARAAPAKSADCQAAPAAATSKFRHTRSRILAKLGSPRHRGRDLIAVEGDEKQTLGGKLAYTKSDKDLEDEDVEIFACVGKRWRALGTARSDDDGRFTLTLTGDRRLPVGMTDLYAHVPGDGSGVGFLGYVAAKGESVIVTDIDGTITSSENAVYDTVFRGKDIAHQPGAPEAFAASGKTVVYVTARGDQLTAITREWLARHGFPRGPVVLAKSFITLPGKRTVTLKTTTLTGLGVPIAAGVGNRASDIAAYRRAGLTPDRIFVNLPEYTRELQPKLAAGEATAFDHYSDLQAALRR
jgi:phosphatidate phosphatase PAH1